MTVRAVIALLLAATAMLAACAPQVQGLGPERRPPALVDAAFVARDGTQLPLQVWPAAEKPRAVIVALHGFNMYHRIFDDAGPWWAARDIAVYAYDQRGFGAAPRPGIWGGEEAFVSDAVDLLRLAADRHPGVPVFLMGESMGGAVVLLTLAELARAPADGDPAVAGAVLLAPAVWGGQAMSPVLRNSLWFAAHTMPWNRATGNGLRRRASDNDDLLRELGEDPLVIKHTRMDAVYGVTRLMGSAFAASGTFEQPPLLVLYGGRDEIVPAAPVQAMLGQLAAPHRLAVYPDGWHMLLSDRQAEVVWRDVEAWVLDAAAPLPSGAEKRLADWIDGSS